MRYVGQPIVAHHVNGTIHRGVLHSVTPDGMYIQYGPQNVSADQAENAFAHSDLHTKGKVEAEPVFFGLAFLPWLALGGFWGGGLWW